MGLGRTFGRMFVLGAGVLAAAGIGSLLKGSIEEAREAQKVGSQTGAVLKSTGGIANVSAGQIDRLAQSLSKKIGVDDEAIQSGENMLLTFTKVRNEAGEGNDIFNQATRTVQDMAAAFGGDAVSNSKQLGKALNDPVKGVTALTRVGVQFTDQQKEQIKKLVESGDLLGAQKIILKELATETKGSAEAQATAGDKARVAFDNLKETVGTALLPVMDRLATFFTNKIAPAFSKFVTGLQDGSGAGGRFADFMRTYVQPVFEALVKFVTDVWLPAFRDALPRVLDGLKSAFNKVKKAVADNKPELEQVWAVAKKLAKVFFERVVPAFYEFIGLVARRLGTAISIGINVIGFLVKAVNKGRDAFNTIRDKIDTVIFKLAVFVRAVREKGGQVLTFFHDMPGKIKRFFDHLPEALEKIGGQIVDGLKRGITNAWHFVTDEVNRLIKLIPKKIRDLMGIGSPSKVTMELGGFIGEGLARGIAGSADKVGQATEKLGAKIKEKLGKIRDQLASVRGDFASLVEPITSNFTQGLFDFDTAGAFTANLTTVKGTLTTLLDNFKKLIGEGLKPGFLYQLFQSGGPGLINSLAGLDAASALAAGSLFGEVTDLSTQLGSAVAGATDKGGKLEAQTVRLERKLDQLIDATKRVGREVGGEVNGAAGAGHRRGRHGGRRAA